MDKFTIVNRGVILQTPDFRTFKSGHVPSLFWFHSPFYPRLLFLVFRITQGYWVQTKIKKLLSTVAENRWKN